MRKAIHESALKGFTLQSSSLYNLGRPGYPQECLEFIDQLITKPCGIKNDTNKKRKKLNIVELGAGTGKFTSQYTRFLTDKYQKGSPSFHYLATEPSQGFLESMQNSLIKEDLGSHISLKFAQAMGSKIPSYSSSLDAVLAIQAFHWMSDVETLAEIYRVLKPNRPLVLMWNTFDLDSSVLLNRINEEILIPAYGQSTPRQQSHQWKEVFNSKEGQDKFPGGLEYYMGFKNHQMGDMQMVIDRIMSTSVIVRKEQPEKEKIQERLKDMLSQVDPLDGIVDAANKNAFSIPYKVEIAWALSSPSKEGF